MSSINNIKKISPALVLRLGLGATFIYAGISSLLMPQNWIGFIPGWLVDIIPFSAEVFLKIHGSFEIILGVLLILGVFKRIVSLLAFFSLLFIIIFAGIDSLTFRDFGLMMAALALYIINISQNPRPEEQN